ncbi:hypothetical protein GCM10022237_46130 [Nocardioides ginsengisoli]|uniref:Uncharacterized protein n=1 Tax=Nocardioides ginsengisoli TaxID=363868 RepID=A0ABW3W5U7_9ACTN
MVDLAMQQVLTRPALAFLRASLNAREAEPAIRTPPAAPPHPPMTPPSTDALEIASWCRLPECTERITRETRKGRARWFCTDEHRLEYRFRGEALDRAIAELGQNLQSTTRREARLREGVVNWLLELRQQYDINPSRARSERALYDIRRLLIEFIDVAQRQAPPDLRQRNEVEVSPRGRGQISWEDLLRLFEDAAVREAMRLRQPGAILRAAELADLVRQSTSGQPAPEDPQGCPDPKPQLGGAPS